MSREISKEEQIKELKEIKRLLLIVKEQALKRIKVEKRQANKS